MSTIQNEYLPEVSCSITKGITRQNLSSMVGKVINVVPSHWDKYRMILQVALSRNLFISIPKNELSIYPIISKQGSIPGEIKNILRNKIISVLVCKSDSGHIYLSRKENMNNAAKYFQSNINKVFEMKCFSASRKSVFFELGAGIVGTVHVTELSNSYVTSAKHYFSYSSIIPIKILGTKFDDNTQFILSYKQTLTAPNFEIGDIVVGKVTNFISTENHSGVFVEVHPLVSGIFDTKNVEVFSSIDELEKNNHCGINPFIILGYKYYFTVRKISPHGLKLTLLL